MEPRVPKSALKSFPQKGCLCRNCPQDRHNTAMSSHGNGMQMDFTNRGETFPRPYRKNQFKRRFRIQWDAMAQQGGRRTAAHAAGGEQLRKELTDGFLRKRVINILLPAPRFNGMFELKNPPLGSWEIPKAPQLQGTISTSFCTTV